MDNFIYPDLSQSDMQAVTTVYIRVRIHSVFDFLKTKLESR
jgi:hypothetical protein